MERRTTTGCLRWILLYALVAIVLHQPGARAQELNRAGLVVQLGDGIQITRCIEFTEPQISGYEVLLRSGLALEILVEGGMGGFVCGIQGEGCSSDNCMCDYPPNYWSYWHLDGDWVYSQMGFGGYFVSNGDVEGWSWGAGEPPQGISFDQICTPLAADTPTPTASWTPSPTPEPTVTPEPAATLTHSPTPPPPTRTPLPTPTRSPADTAVPTDTAPLTSPSVPASTPTAASKALAAATVAPAVSATREPGKDAVPPATTVPSIAAPAEMPTEMQPDMVTTTLPPSATITISEPSATPSKEVAVTDTPRPTQVAILQQPVSEGEAAHSPASEPVKGAGQARGLITILSIGAGVAYFFFVLFLALLAGLFIVVRLRQR